MPGKAIKRKFEEVYSDDNNTELQEQFKQYCSSLTKIPHHPGIQFFKGEMFTKSFGYVRSSRNLANDLARETIGKLNKKNKALTLRTTQTPKLDKLLKKQAQLKGLDAGHIGAYLSSASPQRFGLEYTTAYRQPSPKKTRIKKEAYSKSYIKQINAHRNGAKNLSSLCTTLQLEQLEVIVQNNYSCAQIILPNVTEHVNQGEWTRFWMFVFIGLVNRKTKAILKYSITERSSFGHREITLAECGRTIRINPGISLFSDLKTMKMIGDAIVELDKIYTEIWKRLIQQKKDFPRKKKTLLNKPKKGTSYIKEILRHDEFLHNMVISIINRKTDKIADIVNVLWQFINKEALPNIVSIAKTIKRDSKYDFKKPITLPNGETPLQPSSADRLSIKQKLDANRFLNDEGWGSDSDDEDEDVYARKLVYNFGQSAGTMAKHYWSKQQKDVFYHNEPYYEFHETDKIVKTGGDFYDPQGYDTSKKNEISFDNLPPKNIHIIDITSALPEEVAKYVTRCLSHNNVVLTIESGTKHQTEGLDIAQWGVLRIWANSREKLMSVYNEIVTDSPDEFKCPNRDHQLRRIFKGRGSTLRNRAIMNGIKEIE